MLNPLLIECAVVTVVTMYLPVASPRGRSTPWLSGVPP